MIGVAQARAAKERHGARLLNLPNVVALGIGPRAAPASGAEGIAIKVFVSRKVPLEQLQPHEVVPRELDGVPTDVEVLASLAARP